MKAVSLLQCLRLRESVCTMGDGLQVALPLVKVFEGLHSFSFLILRTHYTDTVPNCQHRSCCPYNPAAKKLQCTDLEALATQLLLLDRANSNMPLLLSFPQKSSGHKTSISKHTSSYAYKVQQERLLHLERRGYAQHKFYTKTRHHCHILPAAPRCMVQSWSTCRTSWP